LRENQFQAPSLETTSLVPISLVPGVGMKSYEFRISGRVYRTTQAEAIEALRGVTPERIQAHGVRIGAAWYPPKQALAVLFGLERSDFTTVQARRAFARMGFAVEVRGRARRGPDEQGRPALRPEGDAAAILPAETELFAVGVFLEWSWWEWWDDLRKDARSGAGIPVPALPGVYEVKRYGEEPRLYIGRSSDLQMRIKQALIAGTTGHQAGRRIAEAEDTSLICIRWAETDSPAAAEEELHRRHVLKYGALPKYTERV